MVAVAAGLAVMIVGSGVASAKQVSGTEWATAACGAQTKFLSAVNAAAGPGGFSDVQAELSGAGGDLAATKSKLTTFFDAGVTAAKTLATDMKKAGVPKITNGAKIEKLALAKAGSFQKLLTDGKKKVATLSTTDAASFKVTGAKVLAALQAQQKSTRKTDEKVSKLDKDDAVTPTLSACGGEGSSGANAGDGGSSGGNGGGGTPPAPAPQAPPAQTPAG
jgi:hypothetical protein